MHALSDPNELLGLAASLARTGEYSDWPAVRARLTALGFVDIEAVVTPQFAAEISEIAPVAIGRTVAAVEAAGGPANH